MKSKIKIFMISFLMIIMGNEVFGIFGIGKSDIGTALKVDIIGAAIGGLGYATYYFGSKYYKSIISDRIKNEAIKRYNAVVNMAAGFNDSQKFEINNKMSNEMNKKEFTLDKANSSIILIVSNSRNENLYAAQEISKKLSSGATYLVESDMLRPRIKTGEGIIYRDLDIFKLFMDKIKTDENANQCIIIDDPGIFFGYQYKTFNDFIKKTICPEVTNKLHFIFITENYDMQKMVKDINCITTLNIGTTQIITQEGMSAEEKNKIFSDGWNAGLKKGEELGEAYTKSREFRGGRGEFKPFGEYIKTKLQETNPERTSSGTETNNPSIFPQYPYVPPITTNIPLQPIFQKVNN